MKLERVRNYDLGMQVHFIRSANVKLGDKDGMLFVYSDGYGIDPGEELLQFKYNGIVHIAVFTEDGKRLWDKQLPDGVMSGIWFVPAVPLDMDKDGVDEIYYVNNTGAPFSFMHRKLERINALTGEVTGVWPWPQNTFNERLSLCYRFYIVAGYAHGEPVLVTCQGTYGNMYLQGWSGNMEKRWDITIPASAPGPRASHMTPVLDINGDGVDELFWGERLLSMDDGSEVIDYAPDYNGHSDVILPFIDYKTGETFIFTCREDDDVPGVDRAFTFYAKGGVKWHGIDHGHIHTAWAANMDGRKVIMCKRQKFVPDDTGFVHELDGIFYFDAYTGEPLNIELPCRGDLLYPIDIDGDGEHEFLADGGEYAGKLIDRHGNVLAETGSPFRMGRMLDMPGEQIMTVAPDGHTVTIWADTEAKDSEIMTKRLENGYLLYMQKLMATGYNSIGSQVSCAM